MRLRNKILSAFGIVVAAGLIAGAGQFRIHTATPVNLSVSKTPERIARGKYIFEVVSDCNGCHSVRDFSRFGGPVIAGAKGKGQLIPGMPFVVAAPNITPDKETGIGSWTDGEKIRAIREGVDRNGRVLFPMMPYREFRKMSDHDVESLAAYLDTLPPVKNSLPQTAIPPKLALLLRLIQKPVKSVQAPARDESAEYGQYLATIAGCAGCHTQDEKNGGQGGKPFAGGHRFKLPFGTVVSANITPDVETGIGGWTEAYFRTKFRQHANYGPDGPPKAGPEQFTLMPWLGFSQLDSRDLAAIYNFLQQRQPVRNRVETHPAPVRAAL